jgi:hypothetical protein
MWQWIRNVLVNLECVTINTEYSTNILPNLECVTMNTERSTKYRMCDYEYGTFY